MKKKMKNMIFNWSMLLALIIVFVSGILVKIMPGMWLGITHAISGLILVICVCFHCIKHGMFKR